MRVWNGPGPAANKSDDRAMDVTVDDNCVARWVWLTGHVREADGVGYDVSTISYLVFPLPPPPPQTPDPTEVLRLDSPTTTEKGVAVTANVRDVYVTASIQADNTDLPLILTFKIDEDDMGSYALDWMRLFGMAISDIPSAIIAPTPINGGVAVFVAGKSFLPTTSHDQVSLRYTEPP